MNIMKKLRDNISNINGPINGGPSIAQNEQPKVNQINVLTNEDRLDNLTLVTEGHPGAKMSLNYKALSPILNMGINNNWTTEVNMLNKMVENINLHIDPLSNDGSIVGVHNYKPEVLLAAFGSDGMSGINRHIKNAGDQISAKIIGGYSFIDIMAELIGKVVLTPEFSTLIQNHLFAIQKGTVPNKYDIDTNMILAMISELKNTNHVKESVTNIAKIVDYTDVQCAMVGHMNQHAKRLALALPEYITNVSDMALRSINAEEITCNMLSEAKKLNIVSNEFSDILADRLGNKYSISLDPARLQIANMNNMKTVANTGGIIGINVNPINTSPIDNSLNFGKFASGSDANYKAGGMITLPNGTVVTNNNNTKKPADNIIQVSDLANLVGGQQPVATQPNAQQVTQPNAQQWWVQQPVATQPNAQQYTQPNAQQWWAQQPVATQPNAQQATQPKTQSLWAQQASIPQQPVATQPNAQQYTQPNVQPSWVFY